MKKILSILFLSSIILAFFVPISVSAGVVPCGLLEDDPEQDGNQTVPCTLCHVFELGDNIFDYLLIYIVPAVASFMIVIAGVMIMFSYSGGMVDAGGGKKGGPALLSQAKKLLTTLMVGLFIIYSAWIIVDLFLTTIGVIDLEDGWSTINCSSSQTTTPPKQATPPSREQ